VLPEANIEKDTLEVLKNLPAAFEYIKSVYDAKKVNQWIVYLGILVRKTGCRVSLIDERLRLTKQEQRILGELLCNCPDTIKQLERPEPMKMSAIAISLRDTSVEGFLYILAVAESSAVKERLKNYLARSQHNKLHVTGEDIKELGYRPGPYFSEALDAVRDAGLDGDVSTKEEEIRFIKDFLRNKGIPERG